MSYENQKGCGRVRLLIMVSIVVSVIGQVNAASMADSILELPSGSEFELRAELEVPANRNFMLLGRDQLSETFNELNQSYNQMNGGHSSRYGYFHYNDYLSQWQETAVQSYRECLERHRTYYSYGGSASGNSTIINQGSGNTGVIINNGDDSSPTYGSYIGDNNCIRPEHTIAMLLLDKEEAGSGGIFREGYRFKVKSVRHRQQRGFHVVTIRFDHDVARGIRIITSQNPTNITINQLNYRDFGGGFWQGMGAALVGLQDIGGDYFDIHLAENRYYD